MARVNEAKRARWRQLLQRWQSSGLGVRAFCDRRNIPESQFWWWRRRLAEPSGPVETRSSPAFVPVTIVGAATSPGTAIDIKLANGHRLRVRAECDRRLLADVVAVLEGRPC
jgi:transposase